MSGSAEIVNQILRFVAWAVAVSSRISSFVIWKINGLIKSVEELINAGTSFFYIYQMIQWITSCH